MTIVRVLAAIAMLAWSGASALADQSDPRLDELFAELKAAASTEASTAIEQQIWSIWYETENEDAATRLKAGVAAMERGNLPGALGEFDRVVEIAPDFAEGWNRRATVRYLLGNYDGSLDDIDRTLALEPRHFGALAGRGLVYIRLEALDEALAAFEEALAVAPKLRGSSANAEALREILGQREI